MNRICLIVGVGWAVVAAAVAESAVAQRQQFPQTDVGPSAGGVRTPGLAPVSPAPPAGMGLGGGAPPAGAGAVPGAMLGQPSFDPYSTAPDAASTAPTLPFGASGGAADGGFAFPDPPGGVDNRFPAGTYPPPNPNAVFPNGLWGPEAAGRPVPWGPPLRFIYGPRLRHTWLPGSGSNDVEMHDIDTSLAVALWPNFFNSGQPLFILPSFSLHLWDGPKPPNPADLPGTAYSAFLDTGWRSDLNNRIGGELGLRVGVFTDFDTLTTDSVRFLGQGLFRIRMTPTLSVRAGILYADRAKIKLLPIGGLLWQPNEMTRFDIYFPQPKLAQYLTTVGNHAVWWYIAGEWGGGSWTIERANGASDRIDINDLRFSLGVEAGLPQQIAQGRRTWFIEAGYVIDREVIYVRTPQQNFSMGDTFMLRAGIGY